MTTFWFISLHFIKSALAMQCDSNAEFSTGYKGLATAACDYLWSVVSSRPGEQPLSDGQWQISL